MKLRFVLIVSCLMLVIVGLASAQTQFSADISTKGPNIPPSQGKMYFGGSKMRMDNNVQGHASIMIVDLQRKVADMIMPQQRMYMEMNYAEFAKPMPDVRTYDPNNPCAADTGSTCRKLGTETVNGRLCDKWEFTGGAGGRRTVWVDKGNHLPIRTVSSDGNTFDMTNIKEGPQPSSLFQVPAGYQKMDMGDMMQGMQGMQR